VFLVLFCCVCSCCTKIWKNTWGWPYKVETCSTILHMKNNKILCWLKLFVNTEKHNMTLKYIIIKSVIECWHIKYCKSYFYSLYFILLPYQVSAFTGWSKSLDPFYRMASAKLMNVRYVIGATVVQHIQYASACPLSISRHCSQCSTVVLKTARSMLSTNACHRSWRSGTFVLYTLDLMKPRAKKSNGVW
jgi:hypothetical protein